MLTSLTLVLSLYCTSLVHAADWKLTVGPAHPEPHALISGYALTIGLLGPGKRFVDHVQQDQSSKRRLGGWSDYGDYAGQLIPNVAYVGGAALLNGLGYRGGAWRRAQVMTVASAEAALITTVLKLSLRERRPNGGNRHSLPSGHATTAFAFAAVVGAEHGWAFGIPAYALATFVGWSRVNDNMHFLHDVVAGATIGISVGLGVVYANRPSADRAWRIEPLLLPDGGGVNLLARW